MMCGCKMVLLFVVLVVCVLDTVVCEDSSDEARELIEQGRTFVHHAVKRFMVILPAIFFKLGIAFTLLIIVSLVAVNNGIIGFLILVVGLSSVLARLQQNGQQAASVHAVPLIGPPPIAPWSHHHFIDRNDRVDYRPSYAKVHYNQMMDRSDSANAVNYAAQVQRMNELLLMQQQQKNSHVTPAVYGNTEVVYNNGYAKTS